MTHKPGDLPIFIDVSDSLGVGMRGNKLRGLQRCFTLRRACVHANVQIGHPLLGVAFFYVVPRASSRKKDGKEESNESSNT
jgi:hypothetical protein